MHGPLLNFFFEIYSKFLECANSTFYERHLEIIQG